VNVGKPKRIHHVEPLKTPVPAKERPEEQPSTPSVPAKAASA
jgi:hypothetical protein